MGKCFVCGKPEEEVALFEGISNSGIRKVCYPCATRDDVTLIKKPNLEQLEQADKRRSVREVMEKLSSPRNQPVVKDQLIVHKNLAKLRVPTLKQEHGDLVSNYDWILKQARRHAKLTVSKVAELAGVEVKSYEALESGQLFGGFQAVALAVERILDVKILKIPKKEINIIPAVAKKIEEQKSKEKNILNFVKEKMKKHMFLVNKSKEEGVDYYDSDTETKHDTIDVNEIVKQKAEEKRKKYEQLANEIESDKFDFSNRENLNNITLNDLADLKKLRQERERLDKE